MGKLKLMTIIGTRPEIIRLSATIKCCDRYFEQILVHTGQNYDYTLNQVFFDDLGLRAPDYYLDAVGDDLGATIGNIIEKSYKLMVRLKPDAVLVLPESCRAAALAAGFSASQLLPVRAGEQYTVKGIPFTAVPAYNIGKPFHPRSNGWVGYVAELDGLRVYVSGDTDDTPEARAVSCDAAFLPVGGTYTMTAAEAAALANALHPQIAVPTHYGSIVGAMTDGDDFAAQLAPGIRCVKLI